MEIGFPGTKTTVAFFEWFGDMGIFCGRLIAPFFVPPYEVREFIRQFDELGAKSLPLAALAGAATGVVLSLSTRDSLVRTRWSGHVDRIGIVRSITPEGEGVRLIVEATDDTLRYVVDKGSITLSGVRPMRLNL